DDSYYASKYQGFVKTCEVWWKSFVIYLDDVLWGHGESPYKILRNIGVLIVFLGLVQSILCWFSGSLFLVQFLGKWIEFIWNDFKVFLGLNAAATNISDGIKVLL